MFRVVTLVLVTVLSTACTSFLDNVQNAAQSKFQQMLANKFANQLLSGIDAVVGELATEGGFLDDPLVRILLPPPLGLAIDVARDFNNNPEAALLETLMNHAAENAIPVAGPILKEVITGMDTETLQKLVDSPRSAATEYLKEKGGAAVQQALLPAVTKNLQTNGAIDLYGKLLATQQKAETAVDTANATVTAATDTANAAQNVSQEQLGQYVAEQATGGLFKKVAVKELAIRDSLNNMVESPL